MKQDLNTRFLPEKTDRLTKAAKQFLSDYGVLSLMGESLGGLLANAAPEERFDVLLSACGFEKDPSGFFRAVRQWIHDRSVKGEPASVKLNNIKLPNLFLYHLLEVDDPGQSLVNAKSSARLAMATGFPVQDPKSIGKVIDKYPVRLSSHVIRQSILSKAVAVQYLPFEDELDSNGHDMTFDGHFKQGLMEQMYRNRAIFLLDMRCPVYCRFCFRKHKSLRHEPSPSSEDVKKAVDRVRADKAVKEILITGGEPLLNRKNLDAALSGLRSVDHVKTLRIATRSLAYYPHLFLHHDRSLVSYLLDQQECCQKKGKRIEIGVHMVHPDEVSVQTLELISHLTSRGIPVYVQTPFLKELNESGAVLERLFSLLRQAGAEIYYIFTPCHPIHGTQKYWSPISLSMEAYAYLRAHTSDRAIPKLCTATPLGKMEWHTSGWAVERDEKALDHIWVRTPYTRSYFKSMLDTNGFAHDIRENNDGTLDVKCLIDVGDPTLFLGPHAIDTKESGLDMDSGAEDKKIKEIQARFHGPESLLATGIQGPCNGLDRVHATRVEMDLSFCPEAIAYLKANLQISDIVLRIPDSGNRDGKEIDRQLDLITRCIRDLSGTDDRPFYFRLRWQAFQEKPEVFTEEHIRKLAGLADFSISRPRRVEIETWFLDPGQITPLFLDLAAKTSGTGIPVYGNTVLISGINDDPFRVAQLAAKLRKGYVDFHHVYVSGLAVQEEYDTFGPVSQDRVLSIASHVRKVCSGREIPLYVIWTPSGEKDFGMEPGFCFSDKSSQTG